MYQRNFYDFSDYVTELPATVAEANVSGTLVVGWVVTTITGESQRVYLPKLRFFEVINRKARNGIKFM
jgi:hypothetical protein